MSGDVVAALFTVGGGGAGGEEEEVFISERLGRRLRFIKSVQFSHFPSFFFSQLPIIFPFAIHFFDV